ncbi:MAG: VWA-like domain-containing protein [Fibrobacter sp.]|nr:VWA-like domain-containing protein [Fibrobacter sp.]
MVDVETIFKGTLCRLVCYSPVSFNLLVGMTIIQNEHMETMGVCVKNGRITLMYNPQFFAGLDEDERTFVLIHEMMHVLLHHCTHRMSGDRIRAYKENVAMDLAINCMIHEETGIAMPRFKENIGEKKKGDIQCLLPSMFKFPDNLSFEQYLALLDKKFPDPKIKFVFGPGSNQSDSSDSSDKSGKGKGNGKGGQSNGDGDAGQSNGDEDADYEVVIDISEDCALGKITKHRIDAKHGENYDEDAFIDDYVRNVVEQTIRNQQWGHLGANAVEMIKKAQEQPLNWGDILRLKMGPFISFAKEPTRRRWNKHYGKPFLGSTIKSVEPVAVYADTSGSVGSADLSRFIVEIERIAYYTGVYLWSFDTSVKDPDKEELFSRCAIESIEFKGRGGTSFLPIFEHVKSKNISQVVILTDGYAENVDASQVEGLEVIWVITKGGNTKGKPGTVVEMN